MYVGDEGDPTKPPQILNQNIYEDDDTENITSEAVDEQISISENMQYIEAERSHS